MSILSLFFSMFIGMIMFFALPFGILILCRQQLIQTGTPVQRGQAAVLLAGALAFGFLISMLATAGVEAGFPYALSGEWTEKTGVFQEWSTYRKGNLQGAAILTDGRIQGFSITNIERGGLCNGDEVHFLVKPAGDSDIYITAWRRPPSTDWNYLKVSFGTQQERNQSLVYGLLMTAGEMLGMLALLLYGVHRWKEPPVYVVGTILFALVVLAAGGTLLHVAYSAAVSDHARVSSAFHSLVLSCYAAMLWTLYAYGRAVFTYNQRFLEKYRANHSHTL